MRKYTFSNVTSITVAVELLGFEMPSGVTTRIRRITVGSVDSTLPAAQMIQVLVNAFETGATPGTGGASTAPEQNDPTDGAFVSASTPTTGNTNPWVGTPTFEGVYGIHAWGSPLVVDFGLDGLTVQVGGAISVVCANNPIGTLTLGWVVEIEQEGS